MAARASGLDGILLVDKAAGWTSHDVVARVRRLTGQRRTGHTGTLDPAATGLLVVCLGKATRLVEYMVTHDKCYEGEITLGTVTETDDAEGAVIVTGTVPEVTEAMLAEVGRRFLGAIFQRPPAYSAISVGGQRSYMLARRGQPVEHAPRAVRVDALRLTLIEDNRLAIAVRCGPGTYIRSLARDIGEALGCGAHLSGLRRTEVGAFRVEEAWSLDDLARVAAAGRIDDAVRAPDEGVEDLAAAIVTDGRAMELAQGKVLAPAAPGRGADTARAYSTDGRFFGVVRVDAAGGIRALKVFGG